MAEKTLDTLFHDTLKDIYYAERKILKSLPKMARAAQSPELKAAFEKHKGYGVQAHVEAIRRHGPCPEHRRTFAPVKTWYPLEVDEAKEEAKKKEAKETAKENKKIQTKAKR